MSDRAYFQEAKRNPNPGLLISEPVVGKISGQWVIVIARRVDRADGGFAGVAYAAITLDQFTQSMERIDLGPHGTVTRWSWGLAGLFTLLTSSLAWLLHLAWKRERVKALREVQELQGLLPICATCKKIRDDEGYWNQIESYVQAHSSAQFTHGICPDCAETMLAEFHAHPPGQ